MSIECNNFKTLMAAIDLIENTTDYTEVRTGCNLDDIKSAINNVRLLLFGCYLRKKVKESEKITEAGMVDTNSGSEFYTDGFHIKPREEQMMNCANYRIILTPKIDTRDECMQIIQTLRDRMESNFIIGIDYDIKQGKKR